MNFETVSKDLCTFIKKSPSCFHAVAEIAEELKAAGYVQLLESSNWTLEQGGKYFVTRNGSSVIAFHVGTQLDNYSFHIAASHSDSPTFKVKENAQLEVKGKYTQLNTEGYGGMIASTWFDRPLSIAGRAIVKEGNSFVTKLVNIDRDLVLIPNVAIHMNREVNQGYKYNNQIDLLPLFGGADTAKNAFKAAVAENLGVKEEDIMGSDLFLYNRNEASIWGNANEYVSSPKLDDLQCAYTALQGFLKGYNEKSIAVYACFDNEEVGSGTKQGAASTFLQDVLKRVNTGLGKTEEDYHRAVASSFLLSADNAHALHPNHPEKSCPTNAVYMNEGIVVKSNANQKYTSDGVSIAIFKALCENCDVPVQFYSNRSDIAGGSTLGNLQSQSVPLKGVDIGLAQLAMHSSYETAGIKDTCYMMKVMEEFFNSHIEETADQVLTLSK